MATYYGTDWSETIDGGNGDDVIYGYGGNDLLRGHGGDDLIYGGAGDDDIYGGSGVNDLEGGSGRDWFYMSPRQLAGGFSDDLIRDFTLGEDRIDVSAWGVSDFSQLQALFRNDTSGDATLNALFDGYDHVLTLRGVSAGQLVSADFIYSTSGPRDVTGSSWADVLFGSSGDDRIEAGAGNDVLLGGRGDDNLIGGAGADRMVGGQGLDLVDYSGSAAGVTVRLGGGVGVGGQAEGDTYDSIEYAIGSAHGDSLIGSSAGNRLWGGAGLDYLEGAGGDDHLYGGDGNDDLVGGAGADILDGGAGRDLADYSSSASGVTVRLWGAASSGGDAQGDLLSNIEIVVGSAHNDALVGSSRADELEGGAGRDYLNGLGGDDILLGGAGDDDLIGGAGSDTIDGGSGVDLVDYSGSSAGVTVRLWGAASSGGDAQGDIISNVEVAVGSAYNDSLVGSTADNELRGGGGADYLNGLAGDDWLIGGAGADQLVGDAGVDTADYSASSAAVTVRLWNGTGEHGDAQGDRLSGIEVVVGSRGNDALVGSNAGDGLEGGAGNDYLNGLAGDDWLMGGAGDDTLVGGAGADLFIFAGASGRDVISDFAAGSSGADVIALDSRFFSSFEEVMAHTTDTAQGAVIARNGISITLTGVDRSDLNAGDFTFNGGDWLM